jgi:ABC-type transporter Mla subunit MlaD
MSDSKPNDDVLRIDAVAEHGRRRAFRTGLLVVASLGVLLAVLVVTGPLRILHGHGLRIDFRWAGPVKPGAAVRVAGVVVGTVEGVDFLAGKDVEAGPEAMVRVRVRIEERAQSILTDRARFYVTTLGVLGEHYVDIEPGNGGALLADNARVDGVTLSRPDLILPRAAALLETFDALLGEDRATIEKTMRTLSSLLVHLDEALAKPESAGLADDVKATLGDVRATFAKMPGLLDRADRLAGKVDTVIDAVDVKALAGTLARAEAIADRASQLLERSPLADADAQRKLVGRVDETAVAVTDVARRADRLLLVIEERKGAAGKLFHDEELASDLKAVLHELRRNPLGLFLRGERKTEP